MGERILGVPIQEPDNPLRRFARGLYELAKNTDEDSIKLNSLNARGLGRTAIINYYIKWSLKEPELLLSAFYKGIEDGKHAFSFLREPPFYDTDLREVWDEQAIVTLIRDVARDYAKSPHIRNYQKKHRGRQPYIPRIFRRRRR